MSDIAPFVAAALRDQTITALLKELSDVRKQLHDTHTVTIAKVSSDGKDYEVFAKGQFDTDGEYTGTYTAWTVTMETVKECPLRFLPNLVVRLGGMTLEKIADTQGTVMHFIQGCYDNNKNGRFDFAFGNCPALNAIETSIRPFETYEEYRILDEFQDDVDDDITLARHLSSMANQHPELNMTVTFHAVEFSKKHILQSLQNVGIANQQPTPQDLIERDRLAQRAIELVDWYEEQMQNEDEENEEDMDEEE